jgi:hypothetical protein
MDKDSKMAPIDWRGDLNVTYTFGGKLKNNRSLTLNVFNQRKIAKIWNVLGMIKGSQEPDRYVMIGNHRDAWFLKLFIECKFHLFSLYLIVILRF